MKKTIKKIKNNRKTYKKKRGGKTEKNSVKSLTNIEKRQIRDRQNDDLHSLRMNLELQLSLDRDKIEETQEFLHEKRIEFNKDGYKNVVKFVDKKYILDHNLNLISEEEYQEWRDYFEKNDYQPLFFPSEDNYTPEFRYIPVVMNVTGDLIVGSEKKDLELIYEDLKRDDYLNYLYTKTISQQNALDNQGRNRRDIEANSNILYDRLMPIEAENPELLPQYVPIPELDN